MSESRRRPLYLTGFMTSGKTTVGQLVASRHGRPFVDLDDLIVEKAGIPITTLFQTKGEPAFRALEHQCLTDWAASATDQVMATGGGAFVAAANRDLMRSSGVVVALGVGLDEARARAGDSSTRPLLAGSAAEVAALHRRRATAYRRAHAVVPTEGRTPAQVSEAVAKVLAVTDELSEDELAGATVVELGERSYPILCRDGLLASLGAQVRRAVPGVTRVGLVTDTNVDRCHGDAAREALEAAGLELVTVVVPAGEASKVIGSVAQCADLLIAGGLDRSSVIVALGGGVVGDLAGFVAATLFRGVPCLQVPTSLLAMVDSAIGGKTGVDTAAGKNLIGAFWQPRAVIVDPTVLATLPPRELRAAFGEILKYGLLDGDELLELVETVAPWIAAPSFPAPAALAEVIARSMAFKAEIVSADERERAGLRALLNLGHTVGHAIEAAAGFGTVLHGEAVALGLLAAARVSRVLGLAPASLEPRLTDILAAAGLEHGLEPWLRPEVLARVAVDKKRVGQDVGFITVAGPGVCGIHHLPLSELERILRPSSGV